MTDDLEVWRRVNSDSREESKARIASAASIAAIVMLLVTNFTVANYPMGTAQELPAVNSASRQDTSSSSNPGTVGRSDSRPAKDELKPVRDSAKQPATVPTYRRELLCDCLKTNRGSNLRMQIVHQPDRQLCYAACVYEDGTRTKGTL